MKALMWIFGIFMIAVLTVGLYLMRNQVPGSTTDSTPKPTVPPMVEQTPSPVAKTTTLESGSWIAQSIAAKDVSTAGITAQFRLGSLSGTDGCNRYTTTYSTDGSNITISPQIAGTQMACPPAVMATATLYTQALPQVATYAITAGKLQLMDKAGKTLVTYTQDMQSLSDSNWNVTGYNNGKEAVTGLIADTKITLNFTGETAVGGNSGCNSYSGTYVATDKTLTVSKLASTMMFCETPAGVSDQETQYLAALQNAAVYTIENGSLVIRDTKGAMQVTAQLAK